MQNKIFSEALKNMTEDAAYKKAVLHLVKEGYTTAEIQKELSFPVPFEKLTGVVFECLLKSGIVLLEPPKNESFHEEYTYVRRESSLGQKSFCRVTKKVENPAKEYVEINFPEISEIELRLLEKRDREYIEGVCWPQKSIFHIANERMKRIEKILLANRRNS